MPSDRQKLLADLEMLIAFSELDDDEEEQEDAVLLYLLASSSRYITDHVPRPRPYDFFSTVFPSLSPKRFRKIFRTSQEGFFAILRLIEDHEIFSNNSSCKQMHPIWQLAVSLARFGACGNGASVSHIGEVFGIGAGTVTLFTQRVMTAILAHKDRWLTWPDRARKTEIKQAMAEEGFPGCVGFIDGTNITLSQKPALDGEEYFDRKQRYSVAIQVVCDIDKRITLIYAGRPGSWADSTVYKRMELYKYPDQYFSPGEYLLADTAYPPSLYCVTAYKSPAANLPENTEFNYCLAKSRLRNEHCIGILKSRWSSLREMRQQIRNTQEMCTLLDWVLVCCVLHNMLAHLGDTWQSVYQEPEDLEPAVDDGLPTSRVAITFREELKATTLATNYTRGVLPIRMQ